MKIADCKETNCGLWVARIYDTDSKESQPYKWDTRAVTWQEALSKALGRELTGWEAEDRDSGDGRVLFTLAPTDPRKIEDELMDEVEDWDTRTQTYYIVDQLLDFYENDPYGWQEFYSQRHEDNWVVPEDGELEGTS